MRWRKAVAVVTALWMAGYGLPLQLLSERSPSENNHELKMTILCDTFEMTGKFNLEFYGAMHCEVEDSKNDSTLTSFKYLLIDANTITINGKLLDKGGRFRVKALGKTRLKILSREDIVQSIWIKQIKGKKEDATVSFSQQLEGQCVSFGSGSEVYLDNFSNPWSLELEGEFQIQDDKRNPVIDEEYDITQFMRNARITFAGSLSVEDPKVLVKGLKEPKEDFPHLEIEFCDDVDKLCFEKEKEEGEALGEAVFKAEAKSAHTPSPNQFIKVIEDEFGINMTNDYYTTGEFTESLHVRNIEKMYVKKIRESSGKLMIETEITYSGYTLFPKIKVTTRYFLVDPRTRTENLLIETSNLEITNSEKESLEDEKVKFLAGKEYKVQIRIEKLVYDNIIVNLEDINCDNFVLTKKGANKFKNNIDLGIPHDPFHVHEYFFKVDYQGIGETPDCFTKVYYWKKEQKSEAGDVMTKDFEAQISSDIGRCIVIKEHEDFEDKRVDEGERFTFQIEIEQAPEISVPIFVDAFLIPDEELRIESGQLHYSGDLEKGKSVTLYANLRAPAIKSGTKNYVIKVFVYYCIKGQDYCDSSDPMKKIIVEPSFCHSVMEYFNKFKILASYIGGSIFGLTFVFILLEEIKEKTGDWRSVLRILAPDTQLICILVGIDKKSSKCKALESEFPDYKLLRELREEDMGEKAKKIKVAIKDLEALKIKTTEIRKASFSVSLWLIGLIIVTVITLVLS